MTTADAGRSASRPTPAVSVLMAVRDGERYLAEAVDSVLGQTLADLELVVVDDGSRDGTAAMLARYAARDARVVVHRTERRGLAASLNAAAGLARGLHLARLDADDLAVPDRLERQTAFLERNGRVVVVGGAATFVDEHGTPFCTVPYPTTDTEIRETLRRSSPFVHSAVVMRREAFEQVGGYRLAPRGEDYDLWLRLAEIGPLANLDGEPVVHYRIHGAQLTAETLREQAVCSLAARAAADARAAGREDPLRGVERITPAVAESLGIEEEAAAAAQLRSTLWYARTLSRAGYRRAAGALLRDAARLGRRETLAVRLQLARERRAGLRGVGLRVRASLAGRRA
jgi:glycosyl transferase family 2